MSSYPPVLLSDFQLPLLDKVPQLKVVMEHITTKDAVGGGRAEQGGRSRGQRGREQGGREQGEGRRSREQGGKQGAGSRGGSREQEAGGEAGSSGGAGGQAGRTQIGVEAWGVGVGVNWYIRTQHIHTL